MMAGDAVLVGSRNSLLNRAESKRNAGTAPLPVAMAPSTTPRPVVPAARLHLGGDVHLVASRLAVVSLAVAGRPAVVDRPVVVDVERYIIPRTVFAQQTLQRHERGQDLEGLLRMGIVV